MSTFVPNVLSSWGVRCLTVPLVAMGMKKGVSSMPCAVVSCPVRALLLESLWVMVNMVSVLCRIFLRRLL